MANKEIIKKLAKTSDLTNLELKDILESDSFDEELYKEADRVRKENYGIDVYIRGLIEFTNYCKNNCYYCGLRYENREIERYRLSKEDILNCCKEGYNLGFRTFVLQGGEDPFYTDEKLCDIISSIKNLYSDIAVTLSIGEKKDESYLAFKKAGADRYLLRHETANENHYSKLHPANMSLANRKNCLKTLKKLGYQIGSGFMVGSPFQTTENIIEDIRFLQELSPDMIGIGPYITHHNTPFKNQKNGDVKLTLKLISILRLMFPYALLPATTALGTLSPNGRELGLKVGANVVMPNLSPKNVRKKYEIYENKICTGEESAQCKRCLEKRIESIGYKIIISKGDVKRK